MGKSFGSKLEAAMDTYYAYKAAERALARVRRRVPDLDKKILDALRADETLAPHVELIKDAVDDVLEALKAFG